MANPDNRSEAFSLWERSLAKFAPGVFTPVLYSVESEPVPLAMLSATRTMATFLVWLDWLEAEGHRSQTPCSKSRLVKEWATNRPLSGLNALSQYIAVV